MMILSDTPAMLSFFPKAAASNKWSVVFSKEASIRTLSFIFATPNRVIPRTSPYDNEELAREFGITPHSYFVGHNIAKQHDVTRVNTHSVTLHGILDFVDDGPSCSFNPQHFCRLNDMV